MSLDVSLEDPTSTYETDDLYDANITHNLGEMADQAGIYKALWRPEEIKASKASHIIELLEKGLADLKARPEHFKKFNAANGWGTHHRFILFVGDYLDACRKYPESIIRISR